MTLHQRCWNHEVREAVCRCPECGRGYCRECVSEHESRLLCAACLNKITRAAAPRRSRLVPAAMLVAGLVLAWILYFATGEGILLIITRMEQAR